MSLKLRELIKKVRMCKTAEEERSVINKESAEIRNMSKEHLSNQIKHRNLVKSIYMQMMGYSTTFIHVTTVNLLASANFTEKRIAYTALCLLLDEKSEVLLLSTQTIKKDLQNPNPLIVGLALNAIGEVCTADMCRELALDVGKLMINTEPFIKKRAACAATTIIRKCPELIENFSGKLDEYFKDKNHGVSLSGLTLASNMFNMDPSLVNSFRKYSYSLLKFLGNLLSASFMPEFDVCGITDPFLQCKILEILKHFGRDDPETSEDMKDMLVTLSSSTDPNKSTGCAILYELVKMINQIQATSGLKSLASNILGKLLSNKDNNYKYIALNTLLDVAKMDIFGVQKHKTTIMECLRDEDISIKRRALDLTYIIINPSNIKQIIKELLNFLIYGENEFKVELTTQVFVNLEKFSPSRKWQIDTLVKMLCLSGEFVSEETTSDIINLIITMSELHVYSVHKLFLALKNNLGQESLVKVAVYVTGELGDMLVKESVVGIDDEIISVSEQEVQETLKAIQNKEFSTATPSEYLMNCYIKLCSKFNNESVVNELKNSLIEHKKSYDCEVQERALEYSTFCAIVEESLKRDVTKRVPNSKVIKETSAVSKEIYVEEFDTNNFSDSDTNISVKFTKETIGKPDKDLLGKARDEGKVVNLIDFDLMPTESEKETPATSINESNINEFLLDYGDNSKTGKNSLDLLSNIYSSYEHSNKQQIEETYNSTVPIEVVQTEKENVLKELFHNEHISINFTSSKNLDGSICATFYATNNTEFLLSNVKLNFMVLKYVSLKVLSTSGTSMKPSESMGIKKDIVVINNEPKKKTCNQNQIFVQL